MKYPKPDDKYDINIFNDNFQELSNDKADKSDMNKKISYITETIPSKVSELENDADYIKSTDDAFINKVDKDGEKVLSDNNYTDADKSKLENLENYDDTNIISRIAKHENKFLNVYVNATNGNDSNDGSTSAKAYATVQRALQDMVLTPFLIVNLAVGTYDTGRIQVYARTVHLVGTNRDSTIVNGVIEAGRGSSVLIDNLTINSVDDTGWKGNSYNCVVKIGNNAKLTTYNSLINNNHYNSSIYTSLSIFFAYNLMINSNVSAGSRYGIKSERSSVIIDNFKDTTSIAQVQFVGTNIFVSDSAITSVGVNKGLTFAGGNAVNNSAITTMSLDEPIEII